MHDMMEGVGLSHFARTLARHPRSPALTGAATKALIALATMPHNALGYIEASVRQVGAASGMTKSTAGRTLIELRTAGLIEPAPVGSFANKMCAASIWLIRL